MPHHELVALVPVAHSAVVMHAHLARETGERVATAWKALASAATVARRRLVSAITPTWHRSALLTQGCIPSVQAQTYQPLEHIIVSDGPDASLAGTPGVSWLPEHRPCKNRGLAARRAGIARARGELIAYLDDDNTWRPRHVELLADALAETGAGFAYSRALCRSGRTRWLVGQDPPSFGQVDTSLLLHEASLLQEEDWRECDRPADWDLVSRWIAAGVKWVFVPQTTLDYRA